MPSARASLSTVRVLADYLDSEGHDVTPMLAAYGWTRKRVESPLALAPLDDVLGFMEAGIRMTGDPIVVARAIEKAPLGAYHVLDYLSMSAPDIASGVGRSLKLARLIDARLNVRIIGDKQKTGDVRVEFETVSGDQLLPIEAMGLVLGYAHRARRYAGGDQRHTAVCLRQRDMGMGDELEEIVGTRVTFYADFDGFIMPREFWNAPTLFSDPILFAFLDQVSRRMTSPAAGFLHRIEGLVEQGLRVRKLDLPWVASALHVSTRTLQRQLTRAGTTFRALVEDVRRRVAHRLLLNNALSVEEIGTLLGYSDASSTTRAFRRWFGSTPTELREQAQISSGDPAVVDSGAFAAALSREFLRESEAQTRDDEPS